MTETAAHKSSFNAYIHKYDARTFIDSMVAQKSGQPLFRQVLQYDYLGRITEQTSQHTGQAEQVQQYFYDERNQLLGMIGNDGALLEFYSADTAVESWHYDAVGNSKGKARLVNNQLVDARLFHYSDAAHPNRLIFAQRVDAQLNPIDTILYGYNASGAMKSRAQGGSVEDFYYDNVQGLVKRYKNTNGSIVGEWRYRYSASGERELKREHETQGVVAPKRWQYYLLGLGGEQLAVYEGHEIEQPTCGYFASEFTPQLFISASEYLVYGLGSVHNITVRPVDPTKNWNEYAITDHLGSTRVVVDEGGAIAGQYDYKPFGDVLWQSVPAKRLSWIDKEKDAENGLGDFGVRKYDDGIGRFTSIDPLWEKYRAWSPYNYAGNNPMSIIDPSGFGWWSDRVKDAKDIGLGIVDGVLSDLSGNDVRTGDQNSDLYRAAKFGTHVANLYVSAKVTVTGGGLVGVGVVAAPETAGGSLVASGAGVVVVAAGTYVGGNALSNIMKSQAKSNKGRSGKQQRLKEIGNDDKASSRDRGWIKQEQNSIKRGKRKSVRVPPGKNLAHKRGKAAKKGNSYKESDLQDIDLHKLQHKYEGY